MIIAVLKEGSAGPLPLSGAAPAIYLGGVERKEEDEGEQGEQSKHYYSSDHFQACTGNIWGIFHSNIFNTKFSKKGKALWQHTSFSNWKTRTMQTFWRHKPYQYSSPWPEETYFHFHLSNPFSLVPCFDVLWTPVFCQLNCELLTEFTSHNQTGRQKHLRLSGNKHLEVNGTEVLQHRPPAFSCYSNSEQQCTERTEEQAETAWREEEGKSHKTWRHFLS